MNSAKLITRCLRAQGITNLQIKTLRIKQYARLLSTEAPKPPSSTENAKTESKWQWGPASWKAFVCSGATVSFLVYYISYMQSTAEDEAEKRKRESIKKSLIGGPWSLVNAKTGKLESSEEWKGKWYLIYFGFTHCPDICPDELNKMIDVQRRVTKDKEFKEEIVPMFFSVDPQRDTIEEVQKYCADFSNDLIGFTGSVEQVKKVAKTFRVYFTEGPKDEFNDYIVDHSVIMYLMDPQGQFVDYYGQNRTAPEIVDAMKGQMQHYARAKKGNWL